MKRLIAIFAGVCALAGVATPAQAATDHRSASTADAGFAFEGSAYGTRATLGHTVTSGKTASVGLGCSTQANVHKSNHAAGVTVPPLLGSGSVKTTADTSSAPPKVKTSATVQNLNLLSGLITGDAVRSVSSTSHGADGFSISPKGTSFTHLVVAGQPITGKVTPNTRIDLAGFGHIVLNEQKGKVGDSSASLTVVAVHLVIDQSNALGIPVGTQVIVAYASTGLGGPVVGTVDGFAYGSQAKAGEVLSSGPSFRVGLSCLGTNGRVKVNEGAGVSIPNVLSTGDIRDTAQGDVNATDASVETTSTVTDANLLTDLVKATAIKADAHATDHAGSSTFGDDGSSFGTLSVLGFPEIGPGVAANTRVHIKGLGTLWLHRVITRQSSIEVRMIELVVRHDNDLGLPIGSDIQIAVSHASVH